MTLWEKIKICNLAKFQNPGQLQLRPRSAPQRAEKQNRVEWPGCCIWACMTSHVPLEPNIFLLIIKKNNNKGGSESVICTIMKRSYAMQLTWFSVTSYLNCVCVSLNGF